MYRAGMLPCEPTKEDIWLRENGAPIGAHERRRAGMPMGLPGQLVRVYPWPSRIHIVTFQKQSEILKLAAALRVFISEGEVVIRIGGWLVDMYATARRWFGLHAELPGWGRNSFAPGECPGAVFVADALSQRDRHGFAEIVLCSHKSELVPSATAWQMPHGGAPHIEHEMAGYLFFQFGNTLSDYRPFGTSTGSWNLPEPVDHWASPETPWSPSTSEGGTTLSRGD